MWFIIWCSYLYEFYRLPVYFFNKSLFIRPKGRASSWFVDRWAFALDPKVNLRKVHQKYVQVDKWGQQFIRERESRMFILSVNTCSFLCLLVNVIIN